MKLKTGDSENSITVIDALKLKHPALHPPHSSTLLKPTHLPALEDLDITGSHVGVIAHKIQGSAGPGSCDSSHWQDALLRFGRDSERLRDAVAELTRHLTNSFFNWI